MSFQEGIGSLGGTVFFQVGLCNSLRTMLRIKPLNQLRLTIWTVYVIYLELVVFLSFDVNSGWLIDWLICEE